MSGALIRGERDARDSCAQWKGHVKTQGEGRQGERPQEKPTLLDLGLPVINTVQK